jgi:hypothetical protein
VTRSSRHRGTPIAAARWPLLLVGSVILVAIAAAAPFVAHALVAGRVGPRTATWISIAVGAVMLLVLATAWTSLRARRPG